MTLQVVVADDQPVVRAGLVALLGAMPDITVVGEAPNGSEAVRVARSNTPDVCLFDIAMPLMDGVEAAAELGADDPPIPVVLMTTFDSDDNIHRALRVGVRGFLLKGAPPEQIAQALQLAASGHALFEPSVMVRIVQRFTRTTNEPPPVVPTSPLTNRELDVLQLVAQGRSNAEVAAALHLSVSTVKFHLSALMTKLGARNRVEVVVWAHRTGHA